jgi:hypothetical protein
MIGTVGPSDNIAPTLFSRQGYLRRNGVLMMEKVHSKRAYYIKLGRGGEWEQSSISGSMLRIGWGKQDARDINRGNWDKIKQQLIQESKGKQGVATRDLNALWWISESTSEDLWVTFSQGTLWWCRLGPKGIFEDDISKYRRVDGQWLNKDVHGNSLAINSIPGDLSKIQGFRGTVCRVRELDTLRRLVNDEPSNEYNEIQKRNRALTDSVAKGIRKLHWKDFETFVDLVFRGSGWRRLSMLGGAMKTTDLELEDPITRDQYQVQVKSQASREDFESFSKVSDQGLHRKRYFVVHTPDPRLAAFQEQPPDVELILPGRLSDMGVRLGLVDWLLNHIK